MTKTNSVVAIYHTRSDAEAAVKQLQKSGFDMTKLSIIGRDNHTEEHVVGYYNTGDRIQAWGKSGAFWGGMWGILFGSAFFWVPGLGPLMAAGPVVTWIVGALEGAIVVGGISAIGAAIASIGIPKDSIVKYEVALRIGKFVLIAHGTDREVTQARQILNNTRPEAMDHHQLQEPLLVH